MAAVLLIAVAMAAARPALTCQPQLAPLRSGTYSGNDTAGRWTEDDAGAWGGRGWLGWNAAGRSLDPLRMTLERLDDTTAAPETVRVRSVPDVDFAVRCVPGLSPGPIRSLARGELIAHRALLIVLGKRRYQIRVDAARPDLSDATVTLTDGRRRQVLYSADGFADDPHFDVEWAGDLDRDGSLDLLVDLNRKYSVHTYRLLLSSRAGAGEILGEAAVFTLRD